MAMFLLLVVCSPSGRLLTSGTGQKGCMVGVYCAMAVHSIIKLIDTRFK